MNLFMMNYLLKITDEKFQESREKCEGKNVECL